MILLWFSIFISEGRTLFEAIKTGNGVLMNARLRVLMIRIVLQQIDTGFFVGKKAALALEESEARTFRNSTAAVDYCIARGIDDVDIVMRFPDPRYDVRLQPFTHPEWQGRTTKFADDTERLARLHEEIAKRTARTRQLLAEMESVHLEAKERRKQYPFKPARVGATTRTNKRLSKGGAHTFE